MRSVVFCQLDMYVMKELSLVNVDALPWVGFVLRDNEILGLPHWEKYVSHCLGLDKGSRDDAIHLIVNSCLTSWPYTDDSDSSQNFCSLSNGDNFRPTTFNAVKYNLK